MGDVVFRVENVVNFSDALRLNAAKAIADNLFRNQNIAVVAKDNMPISRRGFVTITGESAYFKSGEDFYNLISSGDSYDIGVRNDGVAEITIMFNNLVRKVTD